MNSHRHPDGTPKLATLKGWAILYSIMFGMLALKACSGPDELEAQQRKYCGMVALNRADPTVGWPDYNGTFDEECTHETQAR